MLDNTNDTKKTKKNQEAEPKINRKNQRIKRRKWDKLRITKKNQDSAHKIKKILNKQRTAGENHEKKEKKTNQETKNENYFF